MSTNANIEIRLRCRAKQVHSEYFVLALATRQVSRPTLAGGRKLAPAGAIHQLHSSAVVFTQAAQVETVTFEFAERLEQF